MRPFPFVLRALTGLSSAPVGRNEPPATPRVRGHAAAFGASGPDIEAALRGLEMERMESMIRHYRGRPARIENPFAAFPTRSVWLGRIMNDD